ncbi:MAG: D-alanine--D-alanine ligase, partial [Deltaproteobacteria bacterium]|nr:D-alanine--D-alanine ligase [Deltaproteobacteria bacterium]
VSRLAQGQRWDLVFNIAEGLYGFGREAQVPALLDSYGIPYVFSDPLVLSIALHKGMTKRVVRDSGVPTADFAVVASPEEADAVRLPFPLFAKPIAEGTSKGVLATSKVQTPQELRLVCAELLERFDQPVLVETYLPGREFTVGITGTGANAQVLGVLEVVVNQGGDATFYSFHNKEHYERLIQYVLTDDADAQEAAQVSLAAWRALGCRDGGRVDIRQDGAGRARFIEVNPLAGLNPVRSDLPILAGKLGLPYTTLIGRILTSALERAAKEATTRGRQPRPPAGGVHAHHT